MKKRYSCLFALFLSTPAYSATDGTAVLIHYADLAEAVYEDALVSARALQAAVNRFIKAPAAPNLQQAKAAWVAARVPYQQTEAYRFGNAIVDDWEGKVNAWPLDEGLIDYVAVGYGNESDENPYYTANVIANPELMLSGRTIDVGTIDKTLLAETLHEVDGIEANVATGYHAIEFLLWGQDLNGTGPGAGARTASDYDPEHCTHGNCVRRAAYLKTATDLLVDELNWMVAQWGQKGEARLNLLQGDPKQGLAAILSGMGSLSYGELAGERMKLGLMLHDPEEEHDCFSDNTHWSHYYDALGIHNVYTGRYTRIDGRVVAGPSLSDLVSAVEKETDKRMRAALNATLEKMQVLVDSANNGEAYDQLIGDGNDTGNAKVMAAIDALLEQTRIIEHVVTTLALGELAFEGSDSLDTSDTIRP
ncbi:MAG: imelysin family protein [Candidatus Thiodiazotropha sp.]